MKTRATPRWYISGPHSRDYYLLLDEQAGYIFATRLAAHIREVRGAGDEHADLASANLPDIWVDDANKQVWYAFEDSASCDDDRVKVAQHGGRGRSGR